MDIKKEFHKICAEHRNNIHEKTMYKDCGKDGDFAMNKIYDALHSKKFFYRYNFLPAEVSVIPITLNRMDIYNWYMKELKQLEKEFLNYI